MVDIQLINNDSQVRFEKRLWHPTELTLAMCYGFHIHIGETEKDSTIITANIIETHKEAMYEFIKVSFKNFSESISEESRRNFFYARLDNVYNNLEHSCLSLMEQKLPYFPKLYLHQRQGIMFSLMHRVNFLAFEMRLGKSVTAASLSRLLNIRRTVIICPSIAKWGWFRDLTNPDLWGFNELYFTMLDAAKSKSFRALQERFIITNFDILAKIKDHLMCDDIGHFIIDEAHRVKNRFSDRSKIIQTILDAYPNAKITFLSGTPVANRFDDLFNYFKMGGHPLGESFKKFTDEYTVKTASRGGEKITGAKNVDDLKRKMLNFMMVRKMSDCFDMPEDVVSRYTFDLDDYRDEYNAIIEEMAKEKNMAALRGHLHSINIITAKAKMKGIIEIIEEIIAAEGKVVVFGSYKEPFRMLQEHFGPRAAIIDGSVNSFDRDRYKREFWENPELQIILGNYLAAGEALDLSVASDIVHMNFPFTPREIRQAQFRCKHPEKKGHLRIHYTFAKESIDEHIYDNMILSKERDINALMTDGEQVIEMENIEEILIKKLLNKENLDGITYDFSSKKSMVSEATTNIDGPENIKNSQSSGEEGVFVQVLGNGDISVHGGTNMERQVEGEKIGEYLPTHEIPQFTVQSDSQSENGTTGQLETRTGKDALPKVQETDNIFARKLKAEIHPEYPAKGYDSTGGFGPKRFERGEPNGTLPGAQEDSVSKNIPTEPSFEVMAELVDRNEKNGNMFFQSEITPFEKAIKETAETVNDEKLLLPATPLEVKDKPGITEEEIASNWEHVRKTREGIGKGDGIFHQINAIEPKKVETLEQLKESLENVAYPKKFTELPPPPTFL